MSKIFALCFFVFSILILRAEELTPEEINNPNLPIRPEITQLKIIDCSGLLHLSNLSKFPNVSELDLSAVLVWEALAE